MIFGLTVYHSQETVQPKVVTKFNTFKSAEGVRESEIYMDWVWKVGGLRTWAHDCSISVTLVLSAHKIPLCSALPQSVGEREMKLIIPLLWKIFIFNVFNETSQSRVEGTVRNNTSQSHQLTLTLTLTYTYTHAVYSNTKDSVHTGSANM